jgi:hypothetical protein
MNFKKIVTSFFILIFILSAAVQYNDPDPLVWIAIYGLAALACLSVLINKTPHYYVFFVMAVGYLISAYLQWPPQFEGFVFEEVAMHSLNIELARESGGLVICALGMVIMGWFSKK